MVAWVAERFPKQAYSSLSWDDFMAEIQQEFFAISNDMAAWDALEALKQKGSQTVADYDKEFMALLRQINYSANDDKQLQRAYMRGLHDNIKLTLSAMEHSNLNALRNKARGLIVTPKPKFAPRPLPQETEQTPRTS
eukprot:jgi/Hompol1/3545/HPOL_006601-RA